MIPHDRSAEHYARVERERRKDEPFLVALTRVAVEDAIAATGSQKAAGKLLGYCQQGIGRIIQHAREREVNAKLGRSDLTTAPRLLRRDLGADKPGPYRSTSSEEKRKETYKATRAISLVNHPLLKANEEEEAS